MNDELLSLSDLSKRAHMSVKTLRRLVVDIPHNQKGHGKIWVRWSDFSSFVDRTKRAIRADADVCAILRDLREARG